MFERFLLWLSKIHPLPMSPPEWPKPIGVVESMLKIDADMAELQRRRAIRDMNRGYEG